MAMLVEFVFDSEIRRARVNNLSLLEIERAAQTAYPELLVFDLKYRDDENDLCLLNRATMADFIASHQVKGTARVEIFRSHASSGQAISPVVNGIVLPGNNVQDAFAPTSFNGAWACDGHVVNIAVSGESAEMKVGGKSVGQGRVNGRTIVWSGALAGKTSTWQLDGTIQSEDGLIWTPHAQKQMGQCSPQAANFTGAHLAHGAQPHLVASPHVARELHVAHAAHAPHAAYAAPAADSHFNGTWINTSTGASATITASGGTATITCNGISASGAIHGNQVHWQAPVSGCVSHMLPCGNILDQHYAFWLRTSGTNGAFRWW